MSKTTIRTLSVGLLFAALCPAAESPADKCKPRFWDYAAAAFGADPTAACIRGAQEGMEWRARQAELARLEAERDLQTEINRTKAWLSEMWTANGFPADTARAIADTYVPSDAAGLIVSQVRARGWQSVGPGIRNALDNFNYPLANQLLMAGLIVKAEEDEAANSRAAAGTTQPSESIPQSSTAPSGLDSQ